MPVLSNSKHERFAQEVAQGIPASTAYVTAGYAKNDSNAARLNGNERVRARVAELLAAGAERAEVTIERVVRELAKLGFSDIRNVVVWRANVTQMVVDEDTGEERLAVTNEVQLIDSAQISDDVAASIAEISQTDKGGLKIKLHDKRAALVDIGKHLGMFVERREVTGKGGGPIQHAVAPVDMTDEEIEQRLAQLRGRGNPASS